MGLAHILLPKPAYFRRSLRYHGASPHFIAQARLFPPHPAIIWGWPPFYCLSPVISAAARDIMGLAPILLPKPAYFRRSLRYDGASPHFIE